MQTLSLYENLMAHLRQPEYLHVVLNPVPVYGTAFGLMGLVLAFFMRSRAAHVVSLVMLFVSGLAAWPVEVFGERGYDSIESISDRAGYEWLDAHAQRATKLMPVFYVQAAVALLALLAPRKLPKLGIPLSAVAFAIGLAVLAAGAWIAYAGGAIRHKEFRYGSPPEEVGGYEKMR